MPKIRFEGAIDEVTGSKIIVSSEKTKILLDCGLYQGNKLESYIKNKNSANNTPKIDYCILSHAHIDHSGLLPSLITSGYEGNIYSTPATKDLCMYMLPDSVNIFIKEIPVIKNILKRHKKHENITPLYDENDVKQCLKHFKTINYKEKTKLTDDISFTFHDSCHILGSASIKLNITEYNNKYRIWYTSDIGHNTAFLTNEPKIPQNIDYLIIESTYGNRNREKEDVQQKLIDNVIDTYKRGGKLLIPAFSVGRMQTILLILHKLIMLNIIPQLHIYIDSPLGDKITHLYQKYEHELNIDNLDFFHNNDINPFKSEFIHYVSDNEESLKIAKSDEQAIIISASGMMEGGRVRNHAKALLGDKNSTILFVGYNATNTLGRQIQETTGVVNIDNKNYRVRCKVNNINGLSAHADLSYLLNYIENCISINDIKQIYLVHGDKEARINLKKELKKRNIKNVIIPELNKEYDM